MISKRRYWQIRPLKMGWLYSGRPQQDQRWKLSLTSKNETQEPLFLLILHSGVCSHVLSGSNQ